MEPESWAGEARLGNQQKRLAIAIDWLLGGSCGPQGAHVALEAARTLALEEKRVVWLELPATKQRGLQSARLGSEVVELSLRAHHARHWSFEGDSREALD